MILLAHLILSGTAPGQERHEETTQKNAEDWKVEAGRIEDAYIASIWDKT